MKKKISLPIVIAIALLVAAITFTIAYVSATKAINKKLTDLGQKQAMFSTLADIDNNMREKSSFDIDEDYLTQKLVEGYVNGYNGRALLLTAQEYKGSEYEKAEYEKMTIADGCVIVIFTEEQYEALNTQATEPATEETEAASKAE